MKRTNPSKRTQKQFDKPLIPELNNMVTIQEQHMIDADNSQTNTRSKGKVSSSFMNQSYDEEEQQQLQYSIEEIKLSNTDRISTLIGQLLAKNKINAKNAFEVPLIHLNETNAYQQASSDNSWKKLSSALESNNKIYGYRVDAIHNYTYRVLQSITRQEKKNQDQVKDQLKTQRYETNSLNTKFVCSQTEEVYGKYLQKNYRNINIIHLQTFFNVNPVLEKTKRIFDQQGLKGLLLNNLEIKQDLSIRITFSHKGDEQKIQENSNQFYQFEDNHFLINFQGRSIFKNMELFCRKNNIIQSDNKGIVKRQISQLQQLWNIYESQNLNRKRIRQSQSHKISVEFEDFRQCLNLKTQFNEEQVKIPIIKQAINQQRLQIPMINIIRPIQFIKQPENSESEINHQRMFIKNEIYSKYQETNTCNEPQIKQTRKLQEPFARFDMIRSLKSQEEVQIEQVPFQEQCLPQNDFPSFSKAPQSILPNQKTTQNHSNPNSNENSSNIFTIQKTEEQPKNEIPRQYNELPSKLSLSTDLILRQINDYQGEIVERVDLVSQWKGSSIALQKKHKMRKERILPPPIDFLDMNDGICVKRKNAIMNLDKSRKMELKKILKQANLKSYSDFNYVVNTSKWKFNFDLKTFLREYYDEKSTSVIIMSQQLIKDSQNSLKDNSVVQIIDQKYQHHNFMKNCSIKQSKQKIRSIIMENDSTEISFEDIYNIFSEREGSISPALCFLTMLHLTNEHNYELLQKEGEYNFTLIKNI